MTHLALAYSAGRSTPPNDEAHSTPHAAGLNEYQTKCPYFKQNHETPQVEDGGSPFDRLSRQFENVGLRLYWLSGSSVLVSAPALGMSLSLPDLRTAQVYLRQIGGAV